jgi:hypothetical protein
MFWIMQATILIGFLIMGVVLLWLFPNFMVAGARTITSEPLKSLGLGFAVLVATPIVALILLVTVIGIPIGLSLIAAYGVALLSWGT